MQVIEGVCRLLRACAKLVIVNSLSRFGEKVGLSKKYYVEQTLPVLMKQIFFGMV